MADEMDAGLRAVAVREHDPVPLADEADDGVHALARILELLGHRAFAAFFDDRVAAQGDDDGLPAHSLPLIEFEL